MPEIEPTPLSVAALCLLTLEARFTAINGGEGWHYNLTNRISLAPPSVDLDSEDREPRTFVARRQGSSDERSGDVEQQLRTVTFDCAGILFPTSERPAIEVEMLLQDMERAMERPDDYWLRQPDGKNLLQLPVQIVDLAIFPEFETAGYEAIGFGVRCTWTHNYGDPAKRKT